MAMALTQEQAQELIEKGVRFSTIKDCKSLKAVSITFPALKRAISAEGWSHAQIIQDLGDAYVRTNAGDGRVHLDEAVLNEIAGINPVQLGR